jgi:hypothetical protein
MAAFLEGGSRFWKGRWFLRRQVGSKEAQEVVKS